MADPACSAQTNSAQTEVSQRDSTTNSMSDQIYHRMEAMILSRQRQIAKTLGELDGKPFFMDEWKRADGSGGGISAVIEDGNVIERGACNVSIVSGKVPEAGFQKMHENHPDLKWTGEPIPYRVCGLSMIMHPHNPMAPTVHLNYRYFETSDPQGNPMAWWFGGGCDLTPTYLFEEDAIFFHQMIKGVCDRHDPQFYSQYKDWCDKYFVNHHRQEARGIGGIFFDDVCDRDASKLVDFATDALDSFLLTYVPILKMRKDMPFTPEQKEFQAWRRGRYVEFNLVHDRGTSFGLQTPGARVESILCSMPRFAQWKYMYEPPAGTPEAKLMAALRTTRDWASETQSVYPLAN